MSDVDIERTLRDEYEQACRDAVVPGAGLVFWRANIRARSEAARKVDQPITIAQGFAAAAVTGVGFAVAGFAWRSMPDLSQVSPLAALALCAAALAVISPLAIVALGSRMRFDRSRD